MALVLKGTAKGDQGYETIAVIKNGEYVGEEALRPEFESYPLDAAGVEEALAEEYHGHALNATRVPDAEIDLEAYRTRFADE
jgi:hypothetical protein